MRIPKTNFEKIYNFPFKVKIIEHSWIEMSDGARLSAKLWLPQTSPPKPVPAILEFIPYRKRDITCYRDSINHGFFSGNGLACIRVDIRGSGDSDGVLHDEYLEQELEDAIEVINWIARQPWCNGSVGMMGKSWGGFNALQVAALNPPALKAIITVSSSDDRYSTDVHYMGGCLLGDNLSWASEMFAFNSCPPDPQAQGDQWRPLWLKRLEESGIWLKTWLEHSHRDSYWRHGSIYSNYDVVKCPVFAISGWADGYANTVFRLMENLKVPKLGLIGPWGHTYPHMGLPGPGMGFLQEALAWWRHWLTDEETDIMQKPPLRVWMQDQTPPSFTLEKRPGHWIGLPGQNSSITSLTKFYFANHALELKPSDKRELKVQSPLSVGLFSGKWCSFSSTPDLPHDQREEDGGSLVFDSQILKKPIEVVGAPCVTLKLKSNREKAIVVARLSDIHPDGKITRSTYGLFNLCHYRSDESPEYIEEGKYLTINIQLNYMAQRFRKGHQIRIAISTVYWPIVWPSPYPTTLTVDTSGAYLSLPIMKRESENLDKLLPPVGAAPLEVERISPQDYAWEVLRDLGKDHAELRVLKDEGSYYLPSVHTEVSRKSEETYRYEQNDYETLEGKVEAVRCFRRPKTDWNIMTKTNTTLNSDENNFYIQADLDAYQNQRRVYSNSWSYTVSRKFL